MSTHNTLSPTATIERINSIDVTRGIALLGILLMNIIGLGLFKADMDPTNSGGSTGWNLHVWWINAMFFEGTMRGMFSMLFGAGILLFTSRSSENTGLIPVTDLYFRRLLWLLAFGMIHSYVLLWDGEILYTYAIVGMFAFSFRHLSPKHLIIAVAVFFIVATAWDVKDYFSTKSKSAAAALATIKQSRGETLSKEEVSAIAAWNEMVSAEKTTPEEIKEEMEARQQGYLSIVKHNIPMNKMMQTAYLYRTAFLDALSMMLLGMACLKNGILKAEKSVRYYLFLMLAGYVIGCATNYFEALAVMENHFTIQVLYKTKITYGLGRISTTLGHISLIMLFIKSGSLPFLQKALAAVGQTALSNYILQTVICNLIFLGFGFSLYLKLQRYELYYIVFGIWILQLVGSPIWMRYFRYGPLEWLWRSLTYWKKQPLLR